MNIDKSFQRLLKYVEKEDYKGWDPYDGLNSKVFKFLPFNNSYFTRLAWIQGFKRSPINFRKFLFVPKEHNAKGIGLFLTGYCNIYEAQQKTGKDDFGTQQGILDTINYLADLLISLKSKGDYAGACWGYNFDWQNRVFYQPSYTPTVVATSFCADALFNAYNVTNNSDYLEVAMSASLFVLNDLNRTITKDGFVFSYSPLDNSKVYNASLLGARLLVRTFSYNKNEELLVYAKNAIKTIVNRQNENGSWIYGEAISQNWIDNFHTGYNLECLFDYKKYAHDDQFYYSYKKGMNYYLNTFFLGDGKSMYYNNKVYPIDIHAPAQLIVTLAKSELLNDNMKLVDKVLYWTINNMQDSKGFFYYQIKKYWSSRIPYIRWAQAWMFYSMSYYIKENKYEDMD